MSNAATLSAFGRELRENFSDSADLDRFLRRSGWRDPSDWRQPTDARGRAPRRGTMVFTSEAWVTLGASEKRKLLERPTGVGSDGTVRYRIPGTPTAVFSGLYADRIQIELPYTEVDFIVDGPPLAGFGSFGPGRLRVPERYLSDPDLMKSISGLVAGMSAQAFNRQSADELYDLFRRSRIQGRPCDVWNCACANYLKLQFPDFAFAVADQSLVRPLQSRFDQNSGAGFNAPQSLRQFTGAFDSRAYPELVLSA